MKQKTKISVLGCGWLGFTLAETLLDKGYEVNGSSRKEQVLQSLQTIGANPYSIDLSALNSESAFWDCDVLISTLTPQEEHVLEKLTHCIAENRIAKVLITSSTSVYPEEDRLMSEEDTVHQRSMHSGRDLLQLEKIFTEDKRFKTSVLRFGGLFGGGRNPANFFGGRAIVRPDGWVNMTHQRDAVKACVAVVEQEAFPRVFNLVSPEMCSRKAFYERAFALQGKQAVFGEELGSPGKRISSQKIMEELKYEFVYPNAADGVGDVE